MVRVCRILACLTFSLIVHCNFLFASCEVLEEGILEAVQRDTLSVEGLREHYPGLLVGSQVREEFATVYEFLKGKKARTWFSISVPLNFEEIDPVYIVLAEKLGGEIILGGGSDLMDVALHRSEKISSPNEVNVIYPKSVYDSPPDRSQAAIFRDYLFRKHPRSVWGISQNVEFLIRNRNRVFFLDLPAYKHRKAYKGRQFDRIVFVNGESGLDLINYVQNHETGKYIIEGRRATNVPFKHGHIVRISSDGSARLYFRTVTDFKNYHMKRLTLPEDYAYPEDWHKTTDETILYKNIFYCLVTYARGKKKGWAFSFNSRQVLVEWIAYQKGKDKYFVRYLVGGGRHLGKQGVTEADWLKVLDEFGITPES